MTVLILDTNLEKSPGCADARTRVLTAALILTWEIGSTMKGNW